MEMSEQVEQIDKSEQLEINLYDLYYLFRQKLKGIIAVFLLGAISVGAFTYFFIPPEYEATAKVYIVSASSDSVVNLTDLQIGTNLTADYEQLIMGRPMLESVIHNLQLDVEGVKELKKMVKVTNPSGTRILDITATSKNPEESAKIANEMAKLALTWLPKVMESNTPTIAEEAIVPQSPASPNYVLNTMIGALVAVFFYFGFAVIRFLHDDTIRSAEEFERYFGIMPLTTIPEEVIQDGDCLKQSQKKGSNGRFAPKKKKRAH